jgi:hypothetical protein
MTDDLPGYDDWKTGDPDGSRCEFCGVSERGRRKGWQPDRCELLRVEVVVLGAEVKEAIAAIAERLKGLGI